MQIVLLTAGILAAVAPGMGPEDLTAASLEQGQRVRIRVTPPVGGDNPTTRLVDGDARTSHYAKTQITWPGGATPAVTIDLRAPRLVTGIEVGYAGGMSVVGIDRREQGTWATLRAGLLQDNAAKHPKTSWLIARDLSIPAEALRIRWRVGSGGGQLASSQFLLGADDHAAGYRLQADYEPALAERHAQALALADGEPLQAVVPADHGAVGGDDLA